VGLVTLFHPAHAVRALEVNELIPTYPGEHGAYPTGLIEVGKCKDGMAWSRLALKRAFMLALRLLHDDACVEAVEVEDAIVKSTNRSEKRLVTFKSLYEKSWYSLGIDNGTLQVG
jgi:hypothetical protein